MPTQIPTVTQATSSLTGAGGSVLGKDDFLKMLVTQLKYQDPLKPLDGTDFATQLAQFSSVEQLSNINQNISQSLDANYLLAQSIGNSLAAGMIGKDVRASGNAFHVNGSTDDMRLGYKLSESASEVTVSIYRNGALVKTVKGTGDSGDNALTVNGLDAGDYTFSVNATNGDKTLTASTYLYGTITGVRFNTGGAAFLVDGSEIPFSQILEILNPGGKGG